MEFIAFLLVFGCGIGAGGMMRNKAWASNANRPMRIEYAGRLYKVLSEPEYERLMRNEDA